MCLVDEKSGDAGQQALKDCAARSIYESGPAVNPIYRKPHISFFIATDAVFLDAPAESDQRLCM